MRSSAAGISVFVILLFALLLRWGHWASVRHLPFIAELAGDSQEYDRWAGLLLEGREPEEPFFQPPLYPYWMAGIYRLFGHRLSAVYLAQIGVGTLGLFGLYLAGARIGGRAAGIVAMTLGAVYAPAIFHEVLVGKEGLALALLCFGLAALAHAWLGGSPFTWAWTGVVFSLVALLRENFLIFLPFLALAAGFRSPRQRIVSALSVLLGASAVLFPVAWHNARTGAGWLPTTFQGGVNFWIGNHPGADGTYRPLTPGREIPRLERQEALRRAALDLGRPVTPEEASRYWFRRSFAWAKEEPLAFLSLQLQKLAKLFSAYEWPDVVDYYWVRSQSAVLRWPLLEWGGLVALGGPALVYLALRRKLDTVFPVLGVFLLAAASTVAFFLFARYRLLLVPPLLLLVAAAGVSFYREAVGKASLGRWVAALALGALAWAWPHLLGFQPRTDLVAFNLGRLREERGELIQAEESYLAAARAGSCFGAAWMNAGKLAAKRGALDLAFERLKQAVNCSPESPEVWANLGILSTLRGELEEAQRALLRALALDPTLEVARRQLERLERQDQDASIP